MQPPNEPVILVEKKIISSLYLERDVPVDLYRPSAAPNSSPLNLLLINDGQDMENLGLVSILESLQSDQELEPFLCVGIHAGPDRRMEYGVAGHPDFKGRGMKADLYTSFVLNELFPLLDQWNPTYTYRQKAFAGFSLGALSAMDISWHHPEIFTKVGMFSGSFWWRSLDQGDPDYDDQKHRIMHQIVRSGTYHLGMKFYFQCGNLDETKDRNQNGIIDSIDDTLDLIKELTDKGYQGGRDIVYVELKDGRHDVPTWGRAMPSFLEWVWND